MRLLLCVFVFSCLICHWQLVTGNTPASDLSILSNFLKYVDTIIHRVLNVLEVSDMRHPGPIDCAQILKSGNADSGIYRIWPLNWEKFGSFRVYCDMETDGGGWTVFQRRGNYKNPKDYFFKTWGEYKTGFGKINEDFWLGNDRIFALTNQGNYSLRIDMRDKEGGTRFAFYHEFWIENEQQNYLLHVTGYTGNSGDSFSDLNEMKFTTKDKDNDHHESDNCADHYKGGWWYQRCHLSNLNGLYLDGYHSTFADGIEWKTWRGYNYSLPYADMKIRPLQ